MADARLKAVLGHMNNGHVNGYQVCVIEIHFHKSCRHILKLDLLLGTYEWPLKIPVHFGQPYVNTGAEAIL